MKRYEDIVRAYFNMWVTKDRTKLNEIFHTDIVYVECYGPEYHGIDQIIQWFDDWNQKSTVLCWDIKRILVCNQTVVTEWYFECNYESCIDGFDGVTIMEFDSEDKITILKEFQSKAIHEFPYETT